uniref:ABC transporter permease n=1 Tax=Streptomyces sp. NBC_00148 TaxID=2903626 RepID=A0AAU1M2U6_9ACTN
MASTEAASAAPAPSPVKKYVVLGLFPLLMTVLMVGIFVSAMHSPTPNNLPVAVVGSSVQQAQGAADALSAEAGEALDIRVETSVDTAKNLVHDQEIGGAYVLPAEGDQDAVLYLAGAGGSSLKQVVTQTFGQVAAEQQVTLDVEDLAPLPAHDNMGTSSLYLTIGFVMAGFLFVTIVSTAAPELMKLRKMIPLFAGWAALMSVSIWALAGPVIGAVEGQAWQLLGIGWLMIFSVAMVTALLARFLGPLAVIPAVTLFMFLGVPSSGGALSTYVEPVLFQSLHSVLPTPATLESVRSVLYFGGTGVGGHLLTIGLWGAAGLALNALVELVQRRRKTPGSKEAEGADAGLSTESPKAAVPVN